MRGAGKQAAGLLGSAAEQEAKLGGASLEFYRAALPAFPVLLAGFLCGEGRELVRSLLRKPCAGSALERSKDLTEPNSAHAWCNACARAAVGVAYDLGRLLQCMRPQQEARQAGCMLVRR